MDPKREARLAEALRNNLRRRKGAPATLPAQKPSVGHAQPAPSTGQDEAE